MTYTTADAAAITSIVNVLDCADAERLADFWSAALGYPTRSAVTQFVVLADGRLVNLGAAEGHPAMVMDMSFANQALGLEWLRAHIEKLEPAVYGIPEDIDREVARIKLASMGIRIDPMTDEQKAYSESWESGT